MLDQPRRGLEVLFKPPEKAYSASSRQGQVSGLMGTLEAWNGIQARVRFTINEQRISVNVNQDYLYALTPSQAPPSPDTLFRK